VLRSPHLKALDWRTQRLWTPSALVSQGVRGQLTCSSRVARCVYDADSEAQCAPIVRVRVGVDREVGCHEEEPEAAR